MIFVTILSHTEIFLVENTDTIRGVQIGAGAVYVYIYGYGGAFAIIVVHAMHT